MISLIVIAKDSSKTITDCLLSAKGLVAEVVVVVDSKTQDDTAKLAKASGAHVVINRFINYSEQKNFANTLAKYKWILSIDADERISKELITEISQLKLSDDISAYSIPRINYFFGQEVKYSNWGSEDDRQIRLINKDSCIWEGDVHEHLVIKGSVSRLHSPILHYPYNTVEEFIFKLNNYTSSESKKVFPLFDFIRRYFLHKGYKDGLLGLFLCYLMIIYHTSTWVKLWLKKISS